MKTKRKLVSLLQHPTGWRRGLLLFSLIALLLFPMGSIFASRALTVDEGITIRADQLDASDLTITPALVDGEVLLQLTASESTFTNFQLTEGINGTTPWEMTMKDSGSVHTGAITLLVREIGYDSWTETGTTTTLTNVYIKLHSLETDQFQSPHLHLSTAPDVDTTTATAVSIKVKGYPTKAAIRDLIQQLKTHPTRIHRWVPPKPVHPPTPPLTSTPDPSNQPPEQTTPPSAPNQP